MSTWNPKAPGDTISGQVLSLERVEGRYGEQLVLEILDDKTGDTMHTFCPSMLESVLTKMNVGPGDRVKIRYEGRREGARHPYKFFAVSILSRAQDGRTLFQEARD